MRKLILTTILSIILLSTKAQTADSTYHTDLVQYYEDFNSSRVSRDTTLDIPIVFKNNSDTLSFIKIGVGRMFKTYKVEQFLGYKTTDMVYSKGFAIINTESQEQFLLVLIFSNENKLLFVNFAVDNKVLVLKIK